MNYFHKDIVGLAIANTNFRQELVTGKHSQVVLMSIKPGEDIGKEVHHVDQTLVFVAGKGEAELNGEKSEFAAGHLVFVPAGTEHNFTNTGVEDLKLYTVYAPPEHAPGTIHKMKAEAVAAEKD
jgi:mannose-6-phosphate isomerase-like protein (cupin superfamily)